MSSSLPGVRMHVPALVAGGTPASGVERRCPGGTPLFFRCGPLCYTPFNGSDGAWCSCRPGFTGEAQAVCSVTFGTRPVARQTSRSKVIGPSFTEATDIRAPNTPVATSLPRRRSSATTSSTSGSATSPGAAASQDGRRPFRVSP